MAPISAGRRIGRHLNPPQEASIMHVPSSTAVQWRIIDTLKHGPLTLFELADEIDEPPFRVRAELHQLRRDGLVRQITGYEPWQLTDTGREVAWAAPREPYVGQQLELPR
jgi:Mn-dependent DtxR family transcriptional regulator